MNTEHTNHTATALVTGGTRGIGRAAAQKLASEGYAVTCWYASDHESAEATAALSSRITVQQVDITDHDAVKTALTELTSNDCHLRALINCAGCTCDTLLAGMSDEQWNHVINTNLNGTYHVCREVIREMIYNREGHIVNLASLSGVTGLPGQTNYAASKGAMIAFTKALAQETARYGILVNAVSPGLIETDISSALPEKRLQAMTAQIPLGRQGTPEEVAELVFFLVSPKNTYITGQNLLITGGLYT